MARPCWMLVLALAFAARRHEPVAEPNAERPCRWSARWGETHTTKPVALDRSMALEKIVDAHVDWPRAELAHRGAPFLEYIIEPGGMVEEVRFKRFPVFQPPWPEAEQAILDAIYQWEYEPVVIDGVSVPVCVFMTIAICWS